MRTKHRGRYFLVGQHDYRLALRSWAVYEGEGVYLFRVNERTSLAALMHMGLCEEGAREVWQEIGLAVARTEEKSVVG